MSIAEIHDAYCPDRGRLDHIKHRCDVYVGLCMAAKEERERCVRIAETEPEPDGPLPEEVRVESEKVGLEAAFRAMVRATRGSIARRIRE